MLICYVRTTKDIKRDCERRMFRRHGPSYLFIESLSRPVYAAFIATQNQSSENETHSAQRSQISKPRIVNRKFLHIYENKRAVRTT